MTKKRYSRAFHSALDAVANMKNGTGTEIIGDTPGTVSKPTPLRWIVRHHAGGSDIDAYIWETDEIITIARTYAPRGVSARANAELIVKAVNGYEKLQPTIVELLGLVERWGESEKLSPAARREADTVIRRAKRVVGVDLTREYLG